MNRCVYDGKELKNFLNIVYTQQLFRDKHVNNHHAGKKLIEFEFGKMNLYASYLVGQKARKCIKPKMKLCVFNKNRRILY